VLNTIQNSARELCLITLEFSFYIYCRNKCRPLFFEMLTCLIIQSNSTPSGVVCESVAKPAQFYKIFRFGNIFQYRNLSRNALHSVYSI